MLAVVNVPFWFGLVVAVIGLLWAVLKGGVVWDDTHEAFAAPAPTLDFIFICPAPFAFAAWGILTAYRRYPFVGFGLVVYGAFFVLFLLIHILFEVHGRPVRKRQYEEWQAEERERQSRDGRDAVGNGPADASHAQKT